MALIPDSEIRLFSSQPLILELAVTLSRSKFHARIHAAGSDAAELVSRYSASTTTVQPEAISRTAPDPDDDVVIGTAIAAQADLLVTGDQALLSVANFRGVRFVTPQDALRICAEIQLKMTRTQESG
jgi:putative PIN family toxin of toxin-antitoxin system